MNSFVTRPSIYDEMLQVSGTQTFGTRRIGASWIASTLREEEMISRMSIPRGSIFFFFFDSTARKTKPTLTQVELKLGLTSDLWDAVDPEDLIEAIYELCNT